jgi:hypothetical protein
MKMKNFIKILYNIRYFLYLFNLFLLATAGVYGYQIFIGAESDLWLLIYLIALAVVSIYISYTVIKLGRLLFVNTKTTFAETEIVTPELVTSYFAQNIDEHLQVVDEEQAIIEEVVVEKVIEENQIINDFKASYDKMKVAELREIAKEKNISGYLSMKKAELIEAINSQD